MKTIFFLVTILLFSLSVFGQQTVVESVLNNDGTIKTGTNGSCNTVGYELTAQNGTGMPVLKKKLSVNGWSPVIAGTDWGIVYGILINGSDIYVCGQFARIGGIAANSIAKWNGTSWSALGSGTTGIIHSMTSLGSDIYVCGEFTSAGGVAGTGKIARWDGSSWHSVGGGLNGDVDGKVDFGHDPDIFTVTTCGLNVYAGGRFNHIGGIGGIAAINIAKWNGTNWSSLGDANNIVWVLAANGNDVYAGGVFTQIGGNNIHRIAKWNGSTWSDLDGGASDGAVLAIAFSGTNVYAGGSFSSMGNGVSKPTFFAKWNGISWSSMGTFNGMIRAVAVNGSDIYVGGDFTTISGTHCIAKWDGASWSALGTEVLGGGAPIPYAISSRGSDVYAGGQFSEIVGIPNTGHFARYGVLPADGSGILTASIQYSFPNTTLQSLVLTYTADYLGITNGQLNIEFPAGWIIDGAISSSGILTIDKGLIKVEEIALGGNGTLTITLTNTTTGPNLGANVFVPSVRANYLGTLTKIASSPVITLTNPYSVSGKYVITSPKGGEQLQGNSYQYLNWKRTGGVVYGTILLEYSTNSGQDWIKINSTPIAGITRYPWMIPQVNSTNCLVRMSNWITRKEFDRSEREFTITSATASSNFPNPFNPATTIVFGLEKRAFTSLKVYNSIGQQVAELVNRQLEAGTHEFEFNASNLPSGVYFYNLTLDGKSEVHKMMFMK